MSSGAAEDRVLVAVGYIPFEADIDGTRGEISLGTDHQACEKVIFTVAAGYRGAFEGDSHGDDTTVGFKLLF